MRPFPATHSSMDRAPGRSTATMMIGDRGGGLVELARISFMVLRARSRRPKAA